MSQNLPTSNCTVQLGNTPLMLEDNMTKGYQMSIPLDDRDTDFTEEDELWESLMEEIEDEDEDEDEDDDDDDDWDRDFEDGENEDDDEEEWDDEDEDEDLV